LLSDEDATPALALDQFEYESEIESKGQIWAFFEFSISNSFGEKNSFSLKESNQTEPS
jgi:hypothetical protein